MTGTNGSTSEAVKANGHIEADLRLSHEPVTERARIDTSSKYQDDPIEEYRNQETGLLPWERQKWMTEAHFSAFRFHYLSQSRPRSLVRAYRTYKGYDPDDVSRKMSQAFLRWTVAQTGSGIPVKNGMRWTEIAGLYDHYHDRLADLVWAERADEVRRREWEAAVSLLQRAGQIADLPLTRTKAEKVVEVTADMVGKKLKQIVVLEPIGVNAAMQAQLVKAASELLRRSMHEEADNVADTVSNRDLVVKVLSGVSLDDL